MKLAFFAEKSGLGLEVLDFREYLTAKELMYTSRMPTMKRKNSSSLHYQQSGDEVSSLARIRT